LVLEDFASDCKKKPLEARGYAKSEILVFSKYSQILK
jgi:hypothetical protein